MRFDLDPAANLDFQQAIVYSERHYGTGEDFLNAVEAAFEKIILDPENFKKIDENVYLLKLENFPYRIYFEHVPASDLVFVFAIVHKSRKPDYWRERL